MAYYSTGRTWSDYEPVYRYAIATHATHMGRGFDDAADELEAGWTSAREDSRLAWSEAQGVIRAVWQQLGLHPPGGAND